jgi:hypothetical protein
MAFELDSKRGVQTSYGVRTTSSVYGGNIGDDVVKTLSLEFQAPTSGAGGAANGMAAAAWAKNGLDVVIPAGAVFLSADVVVETAFDALTALTIGTYNAADGTTAQDADGLVTAAGSALTAIDAVGDRLVGGGALLVTGTAGLGAAAAAAVIRVLYTGTVPTVGKARLLVRYAVKAA